MIVLEDEIDEKFQTKYIVAKMGLSAGCKGFSNDRNLLKGDVLVFQNKG